MAEVPSNYEVAKQQLAELTSNKLKVGSDWLEKGKTTSSQDAKTLAEKIHADYESIVARYSAVRAGLFKDVLSPLAKRKDFFLGKSVYINEDKYKEQGILFAIEKNCKPLQEAFTKVPALRNLAYASIFNQMDKAKLDANYLPEKTQITMTEGRISLVYKDGTTAGPFDLFPWPPEETVDTPKVAVEATPDLTLEEAQKLFPKELKDILEKDANGVWHPEFKKLNPGAEIQIDQDLSYTFVLSEKNGLSLYTKGQVSDSKLTEIFGNNGWKKLVKSEHPVVGDLMRRIAVFPVAKQHITDSIALGRGQYGNKWEYDYARELQLLDASINDAKRALERLKNQPLVPPDKVVVVPSSMPARTKVQDAVAPLNEGDARATYDNLIALRTAVTGAGATTDESMRLSNALTEVTDAFFKDYGRFEKIKLAGLKELTPPTGLKPEQQKVFDMFLEKHVNEKGIFGRTKPKESIFVTDGFLPAGEYKAVFEDGRALAIKIAPIFGGKKDDKGSVWDFDGRENKSKPVGSNAQKPTSRRKSEKDPAPVVTSEEVPTVEVTVAKKAPELPKGFEKSQYLKVESKDGTKYKLDLSKPFAPNDRFTATIKYNKDGKPEGVDFGYTKPITDEEFMNSEDFNPYRSTFFNEGKNDFVDVATHANRALILNLARRDYYLRETMKALLLRARSYTEGSPSTGKAYGKEAYDYSEEMKFLRLQLQETEVNIKGAIGTGTES